MNTDLITERTTEMSPRFQARLAGAIAWITATSALAIFVRATRRRSRPAVYPLYASAIQLI